MAVSALSLKNLEGDEVVLNANYNSSSKAALKVEEEARSLIVEDMVAMAGKHRVVEWPFNSPMEDNTLNSISKAGELGSINLVEVHLNTVVA